MHMGEIGEGGEAGRRGGGVSQPPSLALQEWDTPYSCWFLVVQYSVARWARGGWEGRREGGRTQGRSFLPSYLAAKMDPGSKPQGANKGGGVLM